MELKNKNIELFFNSIFNSNQKPSILEDGDRVVFKK